jgi:hypothetical protein
MAPIVDLAGMYILGIPFLFRAAVELAYLITERIYANSAKV